MLLLAGCGFRGAYSFSLPGGADVGDDPYTVQVEFLDVLDLVQQSGVKVADVPVGRVDKIELHDDWTALVTLTVNGDVDLPANAVAKIQQSSLLGEKFVELAAPGNEKPEGKLRDHPRIPLRADQPERRGRGAPRRALAGPQRRRAGPAPDDQPGARRGAAGPRVRRPQHARPSSTRSSAASTRRSRRSTGRWTARTRSPAPSRRAPPRSTPRWTDIGPGLDVINQQRDLLVSMLQSLARLGDVGTRIINQSAADTVADLQLLQPILTQLAAAGPDLAGSLDLLLTYPFPASSVIGAGKAGPRR